MRLQECRSHFLNRDGRQAIGAACFDTRQSGDIAALALTELNLDLRHDVPPPHSSFRGLQARSSPEFVHWRANGAQGWLRVKV